MRVRPGSVQNLRNCGAVGAIAAALLLTGCDSDIAKEFRSAAVPQLETGVNSIVDGLVSGAFAIADARDPTSSATDATP